VPGDAENSELYRRTVLPAGHDEIMPAIGKPLGKKQTELISPLDRRGRRLAGRVRSACPLGL
jgi:hypothetical protein